MTKDEVAPLAGARIDIQNPSGKRRKNAVAPLAGARIEIALQQSDITSGTVAPLAGARIEIIKGIDVTVKGIASLPSRERGLKSVGCSGTEDMYGRSPRGSED